jgi:4,4'-diaponeurosporenoate glycosyltransferase
MIRSVTYVVAGLGLLAGPWWMGRPRHLPPATGGGGDDSGTVSVVIPARDAAATLPALLASLQVCASAGGVVRQTIVVDDDSTDGTASVAAAHGATVLRIEGAPPPGWTGKAHACARGAELATAPLLLFLDADVTLAPDALRRLLAAHAAHGGLVSVQPHHRVVRRYEELSATCNVVAMMGTGSFAPWPTARQPAAFGPCVMASAADYTAAGGHASVRGEVIDDVHLARRFAAVGRPVTAFAGDATVSFRMYPGGVRELVDGWTKSLAAGAGLVDPLAVAATVAWITACLAVGLAGLDALVHVGEIGRGEAVRAVVAWAAVTVEVRWLSRRCGTFRWATAVLHPIPTLVFVGLFARSAWLTVVRGRVRWRGRMVAVGARQTR